MTWVTPETGLILGAVTVPLLLLLYFLRLRRQPLRISSTMLWVGAVEDLHANAPFQRLRPSLLLLLQLIALCLIVLSLMRPLVEGGAIKEGKHVILIDRSASMYADVHDGETRFDKAKLEAKELITQIHGGGLFSASGGETMVIAFSESAEIVIPFSNSEQQLNSAIDAIDPSHGKSNIEDALKLARAYTTNVDPEQNGMSMGNSAQLELFSDGNISDLNLQALQRGETIRYHQIGDVNDYNVGITMISAKRLSEASDEVQIFLSLVNSGTKTVTTDVEVSFNGIPVGIQQVQIPQRDGDMLGSKSVVFAPFEIPTGGVVHAAISAKDLLEIDNIASLIIAPPKELKVLLCENGEQLIRTVLEGMPLEKLHVVSPQTLVSMIETGETSQFDVVVVRDVQLNSLPQGRYLLFGPPPKLNVFSTFVEGEAQVMLVARERHPVMRFVRFEDIVVSKGYEIVTDTNVEILLEGSGWPAVMGARENGIQIIYVAFDPLESNWPYLRSFPFFIYNAVQYLGRGGDAISNAHRNVGQTMAFDIPSGVDVVTIEESNGDQHAVQVDVNGTITWGPVRLSGLHKISWDGKVQRRVAVNVPTEELDISSNASISIGATKVTSSGTSESSFVQLWPWALGSVLVVLLAEWWVYQRKTGGVSRFHKSRSTQSWT
ncbi:MAG: VWA domain-containing protein [Phycisphaerae bacterium]|jgi:hypothetical protein|nr:VWA domain-containing protein [Phycisphaerae bacterium]MBT6269645.1 VWA domain-containing protein [Phycisphaerae bacterium]MBT6282492.1 VWA domain-containing protein [Phycisphaerae bacterium]